MRPNDPTYLTKSIEEVLRLQRYVRGANHIPFTKTNDGWGNCGHLMSFSYSSTRGRFDPQRLSGQGVVTGVVSSSPPTGTLEYVYKYYGFNAVIYQSRSEAPIAPQKKSSGVTLLAGHSNLRGSRVAKADCHYGN